MYIVEKERVIFDPQKFALESCSVTGVKAYSFFSTLISIIATNNCIKNEKEECLFTKT